MNSMPLPPAKVEMAVPAGVICRQMSYRSSFLMRPEVVASGLSQSGSLLSSRSAIRRQERYVLCAFPAAGVEDPAGLPCVGGAVCADSCWGVVACARAARADASKHMQARPVCSAIFPRDSTSRGIGSRAADPSQSFPLTQTCRDFPNRRETTFSERMARPRCRRETKVTVWPAS